MRRVFKILFRIALAIAFAIGVTIFMLEMVEDAGEPLREGAEKYLAEATGYNVSIDEITEAEFFPDVHFHLNNILFYDPAKMDAPVAQIEEGDFLAPLLSVFTGQGYFEVLDVRNVAAGADVFTPLALKVDKVAVEMSDGLPPALVAQGQYGSSHMTLRGELNSKERRSSAPLYRFGRETPITLSLGGMAVEGTLVRRNGKLFSRQTVLSGNGHSYGPAEIDLSGSKEDGEGGFVRCLLTEGAEKPLTEAYPCVKYFQAEPVTPENETE